MTSMISRSDLARPDAWHPLRSGQKVAVLSLGPFGRPFLEGYARIVAPAPGPHRYLVAFVGSPRVHERFVHPEYQGDPAAALVWMVAFWTAYAAPALDDFFPYEHPATHQKGE